MVGIALSMQIVNSNACGLNEAVWAGRAGNMNALWDGIAKLMYCGEGHSTSHMTCKLKLRMEAA